MSGERTASTPDGQPDPRRHRRRLLRRGLWAGLTVALVTVGLILGLDRSVSEPRFDGIGLIELLHMTQTEPGDWLRRTDLPPHVATSHVRQIGSNAIPFLLHLMVEPDIAPARMKARGFLLNSGFDRTAALVGGPAPLEGTKLAVIGFEVISTNGWSAIPALERLAKSSNRLTADAAIRSLASIGGRAHSVLADMLEDSSNSVHGTVQILEAFHSATVAIEDDRLISLIERLWDRGDINVRFCAMNIMAGIKNNEALKKRAIEHALASDNWAMRTKGFLLLDQNMHLAPQFRDAVVQAAEANMRPARDILNRLEAESPSQR